MKKRIILTRQHFKKSSDNGIRELRYTEKALLKAIVNAGQKPYSGRKTKAAQADIDMRMNAIMSAVDATGDSLMPTPEFLSAGSTDKRTKSLFVGMALCSHAAYMEMKIPWLVDVENEKLLQDNKIDIEWRITKKRPDFLGRDTHDTGTKWYVFESKGRTRQPTDKKMMEWKDQAKAIKGVNKQKITNNIVSAAYLEQREWKLLWVDPPANNEGVELEFDDISFFTAYYDPIRELIGRSGIPMDTQFGQMVYVSAVDAYVGLHSNVLAALDHQNVNSVVSFARERMDMEIDVIDESIISVFADGVLIARGEDWRNERSPSPNDPHYKKPKPKPKPDLQSQKWLVDLS